MGGRVKPLKKILIVYTNSGAGHRRAAEALYRVVGEIFPAAAAKIVDTLDYATPLFRRTYPQTYLTMVNRFPWLWGWMYHLTDMRVVDRVSRYFRRIVNCWHCRAFEELVLTEKPDVVITTHFLPNEIISHLKKEQRICPVLVTCITDLYPHAMWLDSGVDLYITPDVTLTPALNRLGIPSEKIRPLGIPIDPVFAAKPDRAELLARLGLLPDRFTVLITSGGFGVGPVEELVEEDLKIARPYQLLVVCGNNPQLQAAVSRRVNGTPHHVRVYGFVDNMHELMETADVIITKSGGLTTTEAMAKQLPMIVLYPIPGQELSNCRFIVGQGAGWQVQNPREAREQIENLMEHPEQLRAVKENAGRLGRPQAAREILKYIAERWGLGGEYGTR